MFPSCFFLIGIYFGETPTMKYFIVEMFFSCSFRDKALCTQLQREVQRMQTERKVVAGVARLYGALNMLLIPWA